RQDGFRRDMLAKRRVAQAEHKTADRRPVGRIAAAVEDARQITPQRNRDRQCGVSRELWMMSVRLVNPPQTPPGHARQIRRNRWLGTLEISVAPGEITELSGISASTSAPAPITQSAPIFT